MSKLSSQRLIRITAWVLAGLILWEGGCSRRPRTSNLPKPASPGLSRVTGTDQARKAAEAASNELDASAGTVSNTATTLEVPNDGETATDLDAALAQATGELSTDGGNRDARPDATPEKPAGMPNPLTRLMIWRNDSSAKTETAEPAAEGQEEAALEQPDNKTTGDTAEETKKTNRSRGQRLFSMLRFPWSSEDPEASDDAVSDADLGDPESDPDAAEVLSENLPNDSPPLKIDDPIDSEHAQRGSDLQPTVREPQPWLETDPPAAPTGVSNQAIATLADFELDDTDTAATLPEEGEPNSDALAGRSRDGKASDAPRRSRRDRAPAPVDALRRAILPGNPQSPEVTTAEFDELTVAEDQSPAQVVTIPNRLPVPEVRGIATPWPSKLADRSALMVGSIVAVCLLFAWGLWRRTRAGDEA